MPKPFPHLLYLSPFLVLFFVSCSSSPVRTGNENYFEYSISIRYNTQEFRGTAKVWISADGKVRVIKDWPYPQTDSKRNKNGERVEYVSHTDRVMVDEIGDPINPKQYVYLDDTAKTYTLEAYPTFLWDEHPPGDTSIAQIIGKAKVNGYNTLHARVIKSAERNNKRETDQNDDYWMSQQVPAIALTNKTFTRNAGVDLLDGDFQAVKKYFLQHGCTGLLVRFRMRSGDWQVIFQLNKATHQNIPDSIFMIPAGYKERKKESGY